jgi:hypothetical protein
VNGKQLTALFLMALYTSPVWAAAADATTKTSNSELAAQKSRGTGADENVKDDSDKNTKADDRPAPPEKGGEKSRGGLARLHIDNRSKWFLRIYTQRSYDGTISPWGDGYVNFRGAPGTVTLYVKAVFDDGTFFSWGPKQYMLVPGEVHTVRIKP